MLGAYLVGPENQIERVRIVFPDIEHRDPDPRYGAAVRPGGGPLAAGDSVALSDLFADVALEPGMEFGLFLAAGAVGRHGADLFRPGAGSFAFEDRAGGAATLDTVDPRLVFTAADGSRTLIATDIFHASTIDPSDPLRNALNDGGRAQVVSGLSAGGQLEIRFEDVRYAGPSDRDFNDLIITVESV